MLIQFRAPGAQHGVWRQVGVSPLGSQGGYSNGAEEGTVGVAKGERSVASGATGVGYPGFGTQRSPVRASGGVEGTRQKSGFEGK